MKLAKWAGFEYDTWLGWIYPDGENFDELPDFTESLDACCKWLEPELQKRGYTIFIEPVCDANFSMVGVTNKFTGEKTWCRAEWSEYPKALPLALCEAIEKLK